MWVAVALRAWERSESRLIQHHETCYIVSSKRLLRVDGMSKLKNVPVFARDATGLVRSLGFLDQFVISQASFNLIGGCLSAILFTPYFFPGADLPLVIALGAIPAFALAFVYARFSAGMPRSGGDYVWSTRIMGPLYG